MNENIALALIGSIAPTVAAVCALIIGIFNGRKVDENTKKTETIIEKVAEVHTLTNSNLSKITAALDVANEKIIGMEKLIANMTENKTKVKPPTL